MPRLARLSLPGRTHHVLQRGNNRQAVFFDDEGRRLFLRWLGDAAAAEGCALHAYVLMTNHVHLLLTAERADSIPRLMQSLGRRYVGYVNRTQGRTGTLWEGRYKSAIIDSEIYALACLRYIEANPLRAGMVARPGEYLWSSYRHNAHGEANALVRPHETYLALGNNAADRQAAYRARRSTRWWSTRCATRHSAVGRRAATGSGARSKPRSAALRALPAAAVPRKSDRPRQSRTKAK